MIRLVAATTLISICVGCASTRVERDDYVLALKATSLSSPGLGDGGHGEPRSVDEPWAVEVSVAVVDEPPFVPADADRVISGIVRNPDTQAKFLGVGELSRGFRIAVGRGRIGPQPARSDSLEVLVSEHQAAKVAVALGAAEVAPVAVLLDRCGEELQLRFLFDDGKNREQVRIEGDWRRVPAVWAQPLSAGDGWLAGRIVMKRVASGAQIAPASAVTEQTSPQGAETHAAECEHVELDPMLVALTVEASQRRALAHLAQRGGATLTLELSISAPEPFVAALCEAVHGRAVAESWAIAQSSLGPKLEASTLTFLGHHEALSRGVEASLLRHLGAVARYPSMLVELGRDTVTLADLEKAISRENLFLLQDRSLSIRVRASEWLAGRGVTVPDYDPNGDARERRRALGRYMRAQDEKESL